MSSTKTTGLELQKQGFGDNPDTWGDELNEALDNLDYAITGKVDVVTAGSSYSLTDDDYEADESRALFINCTGTGGTVVVPARRHRYVIRNACTGNGLVGIDNGSTIFHVGSGGSVSGYYGITDVYTDGTTWYPIHRQWQLSSVSTLSGGSTIIGANAIIGSASRRVNDMRIVLKGASHDSGTPTIDIAISEDGTNWSSAQPLSAATFAASATLYGSIDVPGCLMDAGRITASFVDLTSNRTLGTLASNEIGWRLSGGILGVRVTAGGANWDAGTVEVWVR